MSSFYPYNVHYGNMKRQIDTLYSEIKRRFSMQNLMDISVELISRYKKKDHDYLADFATSIGIEPDSYGTGSLFAKIIQMYHPDKYKGITAEIENRYRSGNYEELVRLKSMYLVDRPSITERIVPFEYEESYTFDSEDFGFTEEDIRSGIDDDPDYMDEYGEERITETDIPVEMGFIEAVNRIYVGNLDYTLSVSDLLNLEGEIDVSDFEIDVIDGVEHCTGITGLNLSGNNISAIGRLAFLTLLETLYLSNNNISDIGSLGSLKDLRELDVSFNQIEDISVLARMPNLHYVNLVGNPIADKKALLALKARGVIVVY